MTGAESRTPDEALASAVVRVKGRNGTFGGTGALIAPDLVVTCARVVSDALEWPQEETPVLGAVVIVEFPLAEGVIEASGSPEFTAEVEHWIPIRPDRTGDIAVLRLRDTVPGARPLFMDVSADGWEHGARAVAFTGGEPGEIWLRGTFRGWRGNEGWVELVLADGQAVRGMRGFSGSPIWDNEQGAAVGLMVAAHPEQDAEQVFLLPTKALLREIPELAPDVVPAPPFRGLARLQEDDADIFFGRDAVIEDVVTALRGDHGAVTVYGPSGCGKSSLALAGVVPRMRQAGYDVLVVNGSLVDHLRFVLAAGVFEAVQSGQYGPMPVESATQIEDRIADKGLADAFHWAGGGTADKLVIVLDQAEELLRCTKAQVAEVMDLLFPKPHPEVALRVLVTLRSDSMDAVLQHPRLGPALRGKMLPLAPMSRDQLREVITKPVERYPALGCDPGLAQRILDDVSDGPGSLALLASTLEQLWQRRFGGRLRAEAYEEMEGVAGELRRLSERAWQEIARWQKEADALRLFTGLVWVLPISGTPLPRRLTWDEAGEAQWGIARAFAERHLLVLDGSEENPETAELAHEGLITAWPALREQVQQQPVEVAREAMERVVMTRQDGTRRQRVALAVIGVWIVVLLAVASFGVRAVLESLHVYGRLGPSDTPAVVTAIVALSTGIGTLIGVTLTAYAKYVQARGGAEADLVRAKADMMRAEADVLRARSGLPQIEPSANGRSADATSSAEPDAH